MAFARVQKSVIDQRQSTRQRVHCPAWIDIGDGSPVRACTLWDVSEAGARITVEAPADVPEEFNLVLSVDGSVRRRCRVIWRSDEQIGARYLTAPGWNWTA